MICNPVVPAFVQEDFYPPLCFVKFIGYVRAGLAAFRVGPVGVMEGIRFHLCASPLFHACAEGLAVADEFHVPQSFRLAAAIVPRRREKSAHHQFSPLGAASYAPEPDADCRRERLVPRFRLASRSAASAGIPHGYNSASRFTLPHSLVQSTFHSRMTDAACSRPRYGRCRRFVRTVHTAPWLIACIACHVGRCFPRETGSRRALQPSSGRGERHIKRAMAGRIRPSLFL